MRVLLLSAVSLLTLSAQQSPDGSALLRQSTEALQSYQSYELTQVTTTEPMSMTMTMHMHSAKPGKMRMEMTMMGMGFTMVSDGRNSWMHSAATKSYMKLPSESDIDVSGLTAMLGVEMPSGEAKLIRTEAIEVDGVSHDCWVVQTSDKSTTYWIDKVQGLQLQIDRSQKVPGAGEVHSRTVTQSIKLNPALADSLFVFTPPEGFKETDEIFPGMKAMLLKKTAAVAHVPAAHTAPAPAMVAMEPQAFVPGLNPLHRTEAVYSEAARAQKIHGMVEVLVTIDPSGSVVNAEALSGKELLRPAAIDAIREWKFRPVIRDGHAVYAATQTTVDFMDHQHPMKPEDFAVDFGQGLAATRVMELEKKFPRSPQQVLADLEQDRGVGDGEAYSYSLPELAKAALSAEAFDKAESYAKEMLRSRDADGDAIHDGNMVLGMISMRQSNVEQAKHYLLESGKSKGSPVLGSFGPSMMLAKALLEKGEREAVLQYLEACRKFWKMGAQQIDTWTESIKAGRAPDFAMNLMR
jgi:TonB family protein